MLVSEKYVRMIERFRIFMVIFGVALIGLAIFMIAKIVTLHGVAVENIAYTGDDIVLNVFKSISLYQLALVPVAFISALVTLYSGISLVFEPFGHRYHMAKELIALREQVAILTDDHKGHE